MIHYLTESDIEKFKAIRSEALSCEPNAFGETIDAFNNRSYKELAERFSMLLRGSKNIVTISEKDLPVAMCGFGISDNDDSLGFIWGMYVALQHRRKGFGKWLLSEAERWIAEHNGRSINAFVAAPNESAILFYERFGYEILPRSGTLREGSDVPVYPIRKVLDG